MLCTSTRVDEYASELIIPAGYVPCFGVTLGYSASTGIEAPSRKEGVITIL